MGKPAPRVVKRKAVSRAPSASVARARKALKKKRQAVKAKAAQVEAVARAAGGYGKAMSSPWEVPPGGIKNSPAYKAVVARCGVLGSTAPAPKDRAGAPLKGGFPIEQLPPNVLVDGLRAHWLPDDWAQVVKNTGPGGVYYGWLSPQGKFFYHRSGYPTAIEESLGRKLTARDGVNGILRSVRQRVSPAADRAFLQRSLTAAERRHVLGAEHFHFAVISARRAASDEGQHGIMLVEGHCQAVGITPTWYVDADSLADYKELGLRAVVGGKLTPARNMALDVAKRKRQVCVQISDDISKWEYFSEEEAELSGRGHLREGERGGPRSSAAPRLAAGRGAVHPGQDAFLASEASPRRRVPDAERVAQPRPGGEYSTHHFILGDFFVAEPASKCRFDTSMTLKEDYDFSCAHIKAHGSVLRCNRMFAHARHATNAGGAVATRDSNGSKERANIAILMQKWPGVFHLNGRRQDEVIMKGGVLVNGGADGAEKGSSQSAKTSGGTSRTKPVKKAGSTAAKGAVRNSSGFDLSSKVKRVKEVSAKAAYINERAAALSGKTARFRDAAGRERPYRASDLGYDVARGVLRVLK
ncbi:unnamed protein product [Prorocentrum cordatum]|uniref:Uncharacterized protein n=1 Tax=Prorocentrum cordatum TaxID=2364126 RepID=A0ABN9RGA2_9DINO|nr:unnamed protein product [Polarella glacialis]